MERELKRVARLNLLAERKHNRRNNYLKKDVVELSVALSEAIKERDFHHSKMAEARSIVAEKLS